MTHSNHFFSLLSFKGQKLKYRWELFHSKSDLIHSTESFFDDLICYYDDPQLISSSIFFQYDINTLISYLRICHKDYMDTQIPSIMATLEKVIESGIGSLPFSKHAPKIFSSFFDDLALHIQLEETKLYPYALTLENNAEMDSLNYSTQKFATDHKEHKINLAELIRFVDSNAKDYQSNFAFRHLQKRLAEFKDDMDLHELLEDDVLIPKLRMIEDRIEIN